jgi:hypothetical protein
MEVADMKEDVVAIGEEDIVAVLEAAVVVDAVVVEEAVSSNHPDLFVYVFAVITQSVLLHSLYYYYLTDGSIVKRP